MKPCNNNIRNQQKGRKSKNIIKIKNKLIVEKNI